MHLTRPVMVFAVWWHHVSVIFTGPVVSVSLQSCPLSGSLRQTKACFCLTKYLASLFTVLWLNKVPFNSLIYGYAYSKQIIIFHSNLWWSECTGTECMNPQLWINMHRCMSDCSRQVVHLNYLLRDHQDAKGALHYFK